MERSVFSFENFAGRGQSLSTSLLRTGITPWRGITRRQSHAAFHSIFNLSSWQWIFSPVSRAPQIKGTFESHNYEVMKVQRVSSNWFVHLSREAMHEHDHNLLQPKLHFSPQYGAYRFEPNYQSGTQDPLPFIAQCLVLLQISNRITIPFVHAAKSTRAFNLLIWSAL